MSQTDAATDALKRAAAEAAIAEIETGMRIGLGTGTTAAFAIDALALRVRQGLCCLAVATSKATADRAAKAGIALLQLEDVAEIDLCIDGVDEIDPELRAIKGAGGAMLREKIVARAAQRMIAIADASKAVQQLGTRPVPVEVLPQALAFIARQIGLLGGEPVLRHDDRGAIALTDQGNCIFDCRFAVLNDAAALARSLSTVPGVLGHGLFLSEIDALYLGTAEGVVCRERLIT
jgi:ribose 5-phosphate isomerase A